MSIETPEDLAGLRRVGRVVALALRAMAAHLRPGTTTGELDRIGAAVLREHGARSAPQLCRGFPRATCISINEQAAHGIPGDRLVEPGDLVNLDVSAELDGYFADTGASYPVPPIAPETRELCLRTRRALRGALAVMRNGKRLNGTARAVEREARRGGLAPIGDLCAHGIGRWLHEEPLEIRNVYDPTDTRRFAEGSVIAMETFLSLGSPNTVESADGWTLSTADGSRAAQYEHTVVVTRRGPLILTSLRGHLRPIGAVS